MEMNLKELSQQLNLSQTTVSRALNGYPEVSEATRKRVAAAAAKFNYSPNVRARTLATGKSMSIGHIIPQSRQNEIANMVFADCMAGASAVYAQNGYTLSLSIVEDDKELSAYRGIAERGAVDGILVQSPIAKDPRIAHLTTLGIPFIVHGRASEVTVPYAWLDVNNKRAIAQATQYLINLGHRRIALINGEEQMDFALRRRAGFCATLEKAGIATASELMSASDMSEPNGHDAAASMLELADPPTAFVTSSIILALGIRRAIEERGLHLGDDVSVICFDDDISYLPNRGPCPPFTAMRSSVRAAGARCAELLIQQIQKKSSGLAHELWDAEMVVGASTGPGPYAK